MKTEYDTQAETFLAANGLKIRITLSDTKTPTWDTYQPMKKCSNCKGGGRKLQGFPLGHHQTIYEQERGLNKPIWAPCPVCNGKGEVPDPDALKHGHHYRVTLSSPEQQKCPKCKGILISEVCALCDWDTEKFPPRRITFDFFGSIADAEKGDAARKAKADYEWRLSLHEKEWVTSPTSQTQEPGFFKEMHKEDLAKWNRIIEETTPTPYSVLACISSDAHTPETFKDWCDEYGDSQDSLKALQTFRRCHTFAKRLRAFFTPAELDQLSEIQ